MGNGADKGKCARLKGAKILGNANNSLESIVINQESPVFYLAILKYSLNHIRSMMIQVYAVLVNIPKEIDGKPLYALLR